MHRIIRISTVALAVFGTVSCAEDERDKAAVPTPATAGTSTTAGTTDLPWTGAGTLTLDRSIGEGRGSGTSTICGDWTMTEHFTFGSLDESAEATITCADGDQIHAEIDTTVVAVDANTFTMTITGGTGRYEHASGTTTGRVQEQSPSGGDPSKAVVTASVQFSGTISF